jgi:myo-inositol-1(or 4)-monophosphatase
MLPDIKILQGMIRDVANEEILPRFNKIGYQLKNDGSLITEADLMADKRINEFLSKHYPDIAFMSEEMTEEEQVSLLKNNSAVWCLDPLDGTGNFAAGVPLFASSISLIVDGEVVLAVTYDVIRDEMFSAVIGEGAYLNGNRLHCKSHTQVIKESIALVDFKRLPVEVALTILSDSPYRSQRNLGSTVLEWVWMAANRGQIYLHGGMQLWDCAAGSLILNEAGGYSSTLEGTSVTEMLLGRRSVVASPDQALFKGWLNYLQSLSK